MSARRAQPCPPVRYGVVGLGWFAQVAILPAFRHARANSELAALISGDPKKLDELGEEHGVAGRYGYDDLERAIEEQQLDALYIALPNHLHARFTVRAAKAGVHVLCEKPMAVTEPECVAMIEATERAGVKLMIAYRLHFEEANLRAIKRVRAGEIGEPRFFDAVFANRVDDRDNIRLGPIERGGGTLYDIGIYCLNAARHLFAAEPIEATAISAGRGKGRFADCDEMTAAILRFPGERLATFTSSFAAADHDRYTIHGTEGRLTVDPSFQFRATLAHRRTLDGDSSEREFAERDQIAPEILELSSAIVEDRKPEPSGAEGLADVRIIQALYRSARERRSIALEPVDVGRRPDLGQERHRPPVGEQPMVHVESPSQD